MLFAKISLHKGVTLACLAGFLGAGLTMFGVGCFFFKETHGKTFLKMLRNERLGLWVFTIAHLWFFFNLCQIDEKECESLKPILFAFFGFAFLGCVRYWKDFLIVRGVAVLTVLTVHHALQVGYMEAHVLRPYMSGLFYLWIVLALLFGLNPYRARDLIPVLLRNNRRWLKTIAVCNVLYGFWLFWLAR